MKLLLCLMIMIPLVNSWTGANIRNHPADPAVLNYRSSNDTNEYIRPCYFTNWAQYRQGRAKYLPEHYVKGLCTHMLFAFGWMNADFTVRAYDPADLPTDWAGDGLFLRVNKLKSMDKNLKTLLSFGGWSFGTSLFQEMSENQASRKVFIDSAIAFVRKWGFDGIDIDWEYPSGENDMNKFSSLVQELMEACVEESKKSGKDRLLVTGAVASGQQTIDNGYDVAKIASSFDFILLMSYDFFGAWSNLVGHNSPLFYTDSIPQEWDNWNVNFAANYWHSKGMPKNKIIIGLPTYGRGWTLKDTNSINPGTQGTPAKITKYVQEAGVAAYYEFCEMLANGAKRYWDDQAKVPYLVQDNQWWSYDDEESFMEKIKWLKRERFGGAFVWTLDFDDFNGECPNSNGQLYPLISVIARELGGINIEKVGSTKPETTTTTTTTATTTSAVTSTVSDNAGTCDNKADGFHELSHDNEKFILCVKGKMYPMNCPTGLVFCKDKGHCDFPAVPTSTTNTSPSMTTVSPSTSTASTTTEDSITFKCKEDGFFGVLSDSKKFVRCVNGTPYYFECPNGLEFDDTKKMCDHP